jgi:hypothetical protein
METFEYRTGYLTFPRVTHAMKQKLTTWYFTGR